MRACEFIMNFHTLFAYISVFASLTYWHFKQFQGHMIKYSNVASGTNNVTSFDTRVMALYTNQFKWNSANLELLIDKTSSIYLYVKLKALDSWIFLSFTSFGRNSDSYEYKNKSARRGAQFVPIGMPTTCWNSVPPKETNTCLWTWVLCTKIS